MMCPGITDYKTGKQIGPDTCIPWKTGNCFNYCPVYCYENEQKCPGGMDYHECPMHDSCEPIDSKSIIQLMK